MFQFTEQELAKMRSRVKDNGPVIENMKKFCENALTYGVKVPPTSIATWSAPSATRSIKGSRIWAPGGVSPWRK